MTMITVRGWKETDSADTSAGHKQPDWDATWVAAQEPSGSARRKITSQLATLVENLTARTCCRAVAAKDPRFAGFLQRLWDTIEYHWKRLAQEKPVRFPWVLAYLQTADGDEESLRGNLLAEVVLAQALELGDSRAAEIFERQYMPVVRGIARRIGGERAVDAVDNFLAELVLPRDNSPPRIACFHGHSRLSHWLAPVVSNYWHAQMRRQRTIPMDLLPDPVALEQPRAEAAESPCEELLQPIFLRGTGAMPSEDRLLLQMLLLDGVPQKELAHTLGIHSGTLTRRRQQAAQSLLGRVWQLVAESPHRRRANHCLQLMLAGDDRELREHLAQLLAQGVRGQATA
jgi:DNA-directed RNA polymerase specialized sigma24 family protein